MDRLSPLDRILVVVATVAALVATSEFLYSSCVGTLHETIRGALARRKAAIRPLPLPCGPAANLKGAERLINVRVVEERLTAELLLVVPVAHPCTQYALGGFFSDRLAFVTAAFGQIRVDYRELTEADLGLIEVLREPKGGPTARIRLTISRPLRDRSAELSVVRPRSEVPPALDRFTAAWEPPSSASISSDVIPEIKTSNRLSIEAKSPRSIPRVIFGLRPPVPQKLILRNGREIQQSYLLRLGIPQFPFLTPLLLSLGLALPLLVSLPRHKVSVVPASLMNRFAEATGTLLLFQLTVYLLIAFNELQRIPYFHNILYSLVAWLQEALSTHVRPPFSEGATLLTCVVLGVALPTLIRKRMGNPFPWESPFYLTLARGTLLLTVGGFIAAGWIGLTQPTEGFSRNPMILLAMGVGLVIITGLFALFVRLLGAGPMVSSPSASSVNSRSLGGLASICVLAVVLLAGLDILLRQATRESWDFAPTLFWIVVTSVLGAMLIDSLLGILRSFESDSFSMPSWWDRRSTRALRVGVLLFAAAPLPFFLSPGEYFVGPYTLSHLAIRGTQWVLPVWFFGIIVVLYRKGHNSLEIAPVVRFLGLLGIATVLYSPRITWLYIPVTFLLGWSTLEWFLVRKQERSPLTRPYDGKQLPRLIATVIDLGAAMHAVRGHRRKQLAAMLKGEVDFETYEREREARIAKLASLRQQATLEGRNAEDLVLSFGPYDTAWENGLHGAKWALFFAIPWLFLGSADLLRAPVFPTPYPLWDFGDDILLLVLKWVTIGFLLGYFFPYLRGQSGLAKGFKLFLALTLPTLPFAAILNSTISAWQVTFFWYLQTFIHCMLLGLFAFDNVVLRQGGEHDWRLLFEVHGLPALGLSLSTLAVAIGTAVTALITSQIPGLVGLALRFALPQVDWPTSPGGPGGP